MTNCPAKEAIIHQTIIVLQLKRKVDIDGVYLRKCHKTIFLAHTWKEKAILNSYILYIYVYILTTWISPIISTPISPSFYLQIMWLVLEQNLNSKHLNPVSWTKQGIVLSGPGKTHKEKSSSKSFDGRGVHLTSTESL